MSIWILTVWYPEFDKVLNLFFYEHLEQALGMGAMLDAKLNEDGASRTVCTVVEGIIS